jgi:hypothetical protein
VIPSQFVKRVVAVLAVALLVASCSSKSSEEEAVEDAAEALAGLEEEVVEAFGGEVGDLDVSEETARGWPEKFCSLDTSMTRDGVWAIMGTPTAIYRNQAANQDQYEAWGWDLTIFYDVDDRVRQLQSEDLASGKVPCESVRLRE